MEFGFGGKCLKIDSVSAGLIGKNCEAGAKFPADGSQFLPIPVGGNTVQRQPVGVSPQDIQRTGTYRSGCTQQGNSIHRSEICLD